MSRILSTGGCLPHCMLGYTPLTKADTSLHRHLSGQKPAWADTPPGQTSHWADTTPRDGQCSGLYASYWNTFLLLDATNNFPICAETIHENSLSVFFNLLMNAVCLHHENTRGYQTSRFLTLHSFQLSVHSALW